VCVHDEISRCSSPPLCLHGIGIGLALCKQLCQETPNATVYLGSRNKERGEAAVQEVKQVAGEQANVELVVLDVSSDESVHDAARQLRANGVTLTALVNNAGTGAGLGHGDHVTHDDTFNVNLLGTKRCVDAFLDLMVVDGTAKIINVSSGSGPLYVQLQPIDRQKKLCNPHITWEEILEEWQRGVPLDDPAHGKIGLDHYGLSKALLNSYTMLLAKQLATSQRHKNVLVFSLSPGYIATQLTSCWPGGKPVDEGTIAIKHCLFQANDPAQSGWFFGSDAQRSPLHYLRNPGEPAFDGVMTWDQDSS
jgi:carbonyl reductase 1